MTAPKQDRAAAVPGAAIYALCEPGSSGVGPDVVRYIGQTRHGTDARVVQHVTRSKAQAVRAWLDSLSGRPEVRLLADLAGVNQWMLTNVEHDLIDRYRVAGSDLLNSARRPAFCRQPPP